MRIELLTRSVTLTDKVGYLLRLAQTAILLVVALPG